MDGARTRRRERTVGENDYPSIIVSSKQLQVAVMYPGLKADDPRIDTVKADLKKAGFVCSGDCDRQGGWLLLLAPEALDDEAVGKRIKKVIGMLKKTGAPIVSLLPRPMTTSRLPEILRGESYVHLDDPNWTDNAVAMIRRRGSGMESNSEIGTPVIDVHRRQGLSIVEIRPQFGRWSRCRVAVPIAEKENLRWSCVGPRRRAPMDGAGSVIKEETSVWYIEQPTGTASQANSLYVAVESRPSALWFLTKNGMWLTPQASLDQVATG